VAVAEGGGDEDRVEDAGAARVIYTHECSAKAGGHVGIIYISFEALTPL
jgi:hypothetical protein